MVHRVPIISTTVVKVILKGSRMVASIMLESPAKIFTDVTVIVAGPGKNVTMTSIPADTVYPAISDAEA